MIFLRYTILTFAILFTTTVNGQFSQLYSNHNGLPNSLVNDLTLDSDGMLWIASENGLSCFNGSRFINYRSRNADKHSLANNFIRKICANDNGQLLIGTVSGIQIYDKHSDAFSEVISTKGIGVTLTNVNDIRPLRNGTYFVVGHDAYTLHLDKDGKAHVSKNAFTGKVGNIDNATEDGNGDLWCVRASTGVWRTHGGKVVSIKDEAGRNYNFYTICTGNDGRIYCGHTEAGLYVFNPKTAHFSLLPGTECLRTIRDIQPLPKSSILCIAMDGDGVRYYDTSKCQFVPSGRFYDPFIDLSAQKVHRLHIDEEGNIWMALYQLGVYFASASSESFRYFGPRSAHNNIIGDRCVTSIMEARDKSIWVSTDNGGLFGITHDGKALRHFIADDSQWGLPTTLLGIYQDSRGRAWFGSFHKGSGMVDLSSGRCTYLSLPGISERLLSVYQYTEDKHGTIWAATMGHGIIQYDEAAHAFRSFSNNEMVQWSDCLYYDEAMDVLYAGTYDGVVCFSPSDNDSTLNKLCGGCVVYSISRISDRLLTFCTTSGLIFFDTATYSVTDTLTEAGGLPDNNILAARIGNDGKLWLSSFSGLIRYDMTTKAVEVFSVFDGIQGNEFYKNAALTASDGRLWFGGTNGVTVFNPKGIGTGKSHRCVIQIASLHANESFISRSADGIYHLPDGITSFSIELMTRPIYMSRRVTYCYKIDDGEWDALPMGQTRVTINGLSYGTHHLYMKRKTAGDEVYEEEIYVPYPWYLRWWAWLLWLFLICCITLFITTSLKRRHLLHQELKKHLEEETASEARLTFFMNVVHDLRTPLSLILSPLQRLKALNDDEVHTHLYGVIQKSADRLLRLSSEIMDIRKMQMGKMFIHCQPLAISPYIESLVDGIRDLAEIRQLTLTTEDLTDGMQTAWLDRVILEKVMLNLLGNAIKFTPEQGWIKTSWNIIEGDLHVMVTDNGMGIPDNEKEQVFEGFFQRDMASRYNNGTGLGLSLVRSLLELHHGMIRVEDNPEDHGTRMHFMLPIEESAYSEEEKRECKEYTVADVVILGEDNGDALSCTTTDDEDMAAATQAPRHLAQAHRNIMIVDDDNDILEYLTDELSGIYNIIACKDGREAYATLQQLHNEDAAHNGADVIVADIMMPEVDGLELCHLVRQNINLCHIPVILLTAKASETDMLTGLKASADAYITKPFNLNVLTATINNLLKRADTMRMKYNGRMLPVEKVETPVVKTADETFLDSLCDIINQNIGNPDITSEFIAHELGISRVHLYRRLKELTNQSATNYIRNIRLSKAAEMLSHGKVPIAEVAERVGFKSLSHFSTAFRALYGVTPTEYME